MLESVAVAADSAKLLPTAVDGAACETEPQVGREVALGTVGRYFMGQGKADENP